MISGILMKNIHSPTLPVALFPLLCQTLSIAAACWAGLLAYSCLIVDTSFGATFNSSASFSQSLSNKFAISVNRMVALWIASGRPEGINQRFSILVSKIAAYVSPAYKEQDSYVLIPPSRRKL